MSWGERNEVQVASQRAAAHALADSIRDDKAELKRLRDAINEWVDAYDEYLNALHNGSASMLAQARQRYSVVEHALRAQVAR